MEKYGEIMEKLWRYYGDIMEKLLLIFLNKYEIKV